MAVIRNNGFSMEKPQKPARTQEERNAIARTRICTAALQLFALQGYEATTLSDIGLRAGYSRSLAQYHFPTKTELAERLLDDMAQRDLQRHVLNLAPDAGGEDAWRQLQLHLDSSWQHYCAMHDDAEGSLEARGVMILSVNAIFAPDPQLRNKLNDISETLHARVVAALRLCMRDGILKPGLDADAVAMFYLSHIWSLANTLYANPGQRARIAAMIDIFKTFLRTLLTDPQRA
jgi:AcrR family transcriptional regulator